MSEGQQEEPEKMNKETQFKRFFQFTSLVTDAFPRRGARILDITVRNLLGNVLVSKAVERQARRQFSRAKKFEKILLVADLNIGDAIIAQGAVSALRNIFPKARLDCVVKKSAGDLIEGNPDISNLYPVYLGAPFPNDSDIDGLARIASAEDYDLVINFSPMIDDKIFGKKNVVNYSMMAAELIRNEGRQGSVINNVVFQSHYFIGQIFREMVGPDFAKKFTGAKLYLSDEALEGAKNFLLSKGIPQDEPIVMFNPDASAKFTRMPFDFQLSILRRLSVMQCSVLLGAGHVERFIEHELLFSLAPEHRKRITVIPSSTGLDVYTALIDLSDVFISGDTGPLHLAESEERQKP